jgi:hypothetical protein
MNPAGPTIAQRVSQLVSRSGWPRILSDLDAKLAGAKETSK